MAPPQNVVAGPGGQAHASKKSLLDRDAAVAYAGKYWDKTCGDGVIALKSVPTKVVDPGAAFRLPLTGAGYDGRVEAANVPDGSGEILEEDMEDCTHFTSCCIGRPVDKAAIIQQNLAGKPSSTWPREKSGGLWIPQESGLGTVYTCGYVGAPGLVTHLKTIGKVIGTEKQDRTSATLPPEMQPGDVIAYGNNVDPRDKKLPPEQQRILPYSYYQHCTIHLGSGNIACHSASRMSSPWNQVGLPFVTFIHIIV